MNKQQKIEPYYQKEGKRIVDMLFDGNLFKDKVTRDDLKAVEDLLAYLLQSQARSSQKVAEIMLRIKK